MRTPFFLLIALCSMFVFAGSLSAQTASNFSNPGVEYKKAPNTLKVKKHEKIVRTNRFNAHHKTSGNGNKHPYISKRKKVQKKTMSLNKKHRNKDRGNKAPATW